MDMKVTMHSNLADGVLPDGEDNDADDDECDRSTDR
jgi:hypothetical protein